MYPTMDLSVIASFELVQFSTVLDYFCKENY